MPAAPNVPEFDIDALLNSVDASLRPQAEVPANGNGSHPPDVARIDLPDPEELINSLFGQAAEVIEVPDEVENEVVTKPTPIPKPPTSPLGSSWMRSDTLGDVIADPESAKEYEEVSRQMDLTAGLERALASLNELERRIIKMRYLGEQKLTLDAVGEELNLNRERVRQIEVRGLFKLRHPANASHIGGLAIYIENE